ncbi:MAG: type II toxin-antitoxin system Phd/YefM family antitoxin [Candidatus Sumerlaeia bacterium]
MTRISSSQAQADLKGVVRRVASKRESIILRQSGKDMAALVPMEDFKKLERLRKEAEDRADAALFKRAKRQFEKSGQPGVSLKEIKKRLGL